MFPTLQRVQRDTRLCSLISHRLLRCTLTFAPLRGSSFTSLCHSSAPSPSAVAAAVAASRARARSIPAYYHHRIPNRTPGALSDPSNKSNSDCVAMYCVTVFCRRLIYSYIVKNPDFPLAAAVEVYIHLPSGVLRGRRPVRRLVTWV